MNGMRHPKTTQERRQNQDGWCRPVRGMKRLPNSYDDYWVRAEKCWKSYRTTQYRVLVVEEDDPKSVKHARYVKAKAKKHVDPEVGRETLFLDTNGEPRKDEGTDAK